jgi:hypothetical protein
VIEEEDGVGEVDAPVVAGIGGIRAGKRAAAHQGVEDGDGVAEPEPGAPIDIAPLEGGIGIPPLEGGSNVVPRDRRVFAGGEERARERC